MKNELLKRFIRISYFAMLTVIGALVRYNIEPLPITLQAFFFFFFGIIIGAFDGAAAQLLYFILGMIGLPVFAYGGGYTYIFEPTLGYLIGMIGGAYVTGITLRRFKTLKFPTMFVCGIIGLAVIYVFGGAYQLIIFMTARGFSFAAAAGTLLYLPLSFAVQAVALLIASLIYPKVKTMIGSINKENIKDNGMPLPPNPKQPDPTVNSRYGQKKRV